MGRLPYFTLCAALAAASCAARAAGTIADVTIVDRDSGAALYMYYYHGEYWVGGPSRRAVRDRDPQRRGGRLLAVTSVDGVNVLSGDTAGFDQAGYVFDPGERTRSPAGARATPRWQPSRSPTRSEDSYAARTGRPGNVGIIGIALFRERQPRRVYAQTPRSANRRPRPRAHTSPPRWPPRLSPRAPGSRARCRRRHPRRTSRNRARRARRLRRRGHGVSPLAAQPNEVIRIRYDSLENLVAMGIIRKRASAPRAPNAFPGSPEHGTSCPIRRAEHGTAIMECMRDSPIQ